ncbi:TPA: hypothetical protein N0F65_007444 [Lagenidium giganteum]|uniref:EMC2 TPR-like domain-containing protein n=1 Tax=Lagenidium giganteum TaxID=4803 RepID=A0AAV2ZKX4_9STRA|nr:TPA: hypothetical protein N0F65_007444 [Lagenidium giganteum]
MFGSAMMLRAAVARRAAALQPACNHAIAAMSTLQASSILHYLPTLQASIPADRTKIRQLVATFEETVRNFRPNKVPKVNANEVFANNHLRLSQIDVVGFDYDYTLCHYTPELQHLIYDMARDFLVKKLRYPQGMAELNFDPTFAIRGLTIDKERGLLCKISSHQKLCHSSVYRGRQRLTRDEIMSLYNGSRHIPVAYRDNKMEPLNDLFSVAHACLFADVVQFLIDENIEYEPIAIVEDVHAAIAQVHLGGRMHKVVAQDLPKYIEPNKGLRPLLERIRSSGKKMFLCTNSSFPYIDAGLRYMVGEDWRQLFDVTIVSARKPNFYTRHRAFRLLCPERKQVQWQAVRDLKSGQVYTQGSLNQLSKLTGWGGNRVLYIGLFSDLVEPSRTNGWRTGAIIRELEDEIRVQRSPEYQFLAFQISALEELMRLIQNDLRVERSNGNIDFVWQLVDIHEHLQNSMEQMINTNFGSVFRADNYPSQFAFFVQRYVDIYSARLENLLEYPSNYTFYPERLGLPHEQGPDPRRHVRRSKSEHRPTDTMGMTDYEKKLALAEKHSSYDSYVEVLKHIRKDKMRESHVVVKYGRVLIDKYKWSLGDELWTVYEQVFTAALDLHEVELAEALRKQFPKSSRVARLTGMELEFRGEYAKAEELYEEELKANPANLLIMKRKVTVLKAQKKIPEAIQALNDLLRSFQTDVAGWTELAELYLSLGAYRYGAFCYEELVLINPMDSFYHSRLADIYVTIGGIDNLRVARKHYSHSVEMNKTMNVRAYIGLVECTKSISALRTKADTEDVELNQRVHDFALSYLRGHYADKAPEQLAAIADKALSSL